jgi:alkylation response protein AidB-like acyl-CoA dehydrogenase
MLNDPLPQLAEARQQLDAFISTHVAAHLPEWQARSAIPRRFFETLGSQGWMGVDWDGSQLERQSGSRATLVQERLARVSPGVAVAVLIVADLGLTALEKYGGAGLQQRYGAAAAAGKTLICLGNSETVAGSDAAGIRMSAARVDGGWRLNGAKAYVTNGSISDLAVVTAVTDVGAARNRRMSMFLVDLTAPGVTRRALNKAVWQPSDLTRLTFKDVFVPQDHLMGAPGQGLQQVLSIFTHSRIPIAGLALGTAIGAFDMAVKHARKRKLFGRPMVEFQAKAFEIADVYARLQATHLMVYHAAEAMDRHQDFRLEASLAKYLAVNIAQDIGQWAADLFGAASVIQHHPIHKFPMDAWAVALAEGTQDVQKLVIFRELMKRWDHAARD